MDVIPQAAPALRLRRYREPIEAGVAAALAGGGALIGGPVVEAFEAAFAAWVGTRWCVSVNSGTDAVALALRAVGVGPGDEVIAPSLTAPGTGIGVLQAGATLRLVDVDPATRCLDPDAVAAAITERTAAVVPVHLHGHPADVDALAALCARHDLVLVEDAAQAHGAQVGGRRAGTFGRAAAFSFYPTKNLGAAGDGGAVVTDDAEVAARVRSLRALGWRDERRVSEELGMNSRLDAVQAAVLHALLPHADEGNAERAAAAATLRERLADAPVGLPPAPPGAVFHQWALTAPDRDALAGRLREQGVGTAVHYATPLHRQPLFAAAAPEPLPATDALAGTLLSLPIQPELGGPHAERIADAVEACARS